MGGVVLSRLQHLHDDDEHFRELSPLAEDLPLPINHRHSCAQHPAHQPADAAHSRLNVYSIIIKSCVTPSSLNHVKLPKTRHTGPRISWPPIPLPNSPEPGPSINPPTMRPKDFAQSKRLIPRASFPKEQLAPPHPPRNPITPTNGVAAMVRERLLPTRRFGRCRLSLERMGWTSQPSG
jgi:hypothetical protein